ncbi:MAG: TlpA family protein disulfide reductase [Myxococcales bacterium]|nr:TlpA family protein disulfide reductase [Myxococcales bacterium]
MAMLLSMLGLSLAGVPGPALHVGDPALLFNLQAINEDAALHAVARTSVSLADFTGVMPGFPAKALVVHFLHKTGGEAQLAALGRLDKKYLGKGVRTIAILAGPGEIAAVSDWVETQHLDYPVLRDAHGIVVSRYGVRQFPTTFVVDGDGDVAAIGVAKAELEAALDQVLRGFFSR